MTASNGEKLAKILGVDKTMLENWDRLMSERIGRSGILEKAAEENSRRIVSTMKLLNLAENSSGQQIRSALRREIIKHEAQLRELLETVEGKDEFEKAAALVKRIATVGRGFFLKKEYAQEILKKRNPANLLGYLGLKSVDDLLSQYDVAEAFSALRFVESDEWMHQTFEEAYGNFTAADFEEREIEIKVLGSRWREVAEKFVAKKHHNVSHLKEFGVIFLNPIQQDVPGKLLRDFALLLHYFHEIEFYSKLFRRYFQAPDFAAKLKALLRGDVPEIYKAEPGEWLIVQRYLFKENPRDPRLFMPRVNPESMHWARGERDLTRFKSPAAKFDLALWHDLDWVGDLFNGDQNLVSFDLEDNAMSFVSFMEGKEETFNYHQREAMWTRIFSDYAGGEEAMEKFLLDNFDKGIIKF